MIIDSFDNQTEPIILPSAFFGDQQNYCDKFYVALEIAEWIIKQ